MSGRHVLMGTAIALLSAAPMLGVEPSVLRGPSFIPEGMLNGSSLASWHTVGTATWHLENGEVTGTPGPSGIGGWLVLNRSYQDVGLYAKFKCSGGCQTGILFRIEKTGDGGMKGSYAELSGGDTVAYYAITVDPDGKIVDRKPLPGGGGQMRIAPPPNPNQAARRNRPPSGGVVDANGYGPIGFYVGWSGEVQYEEIAYKDLMLRDRAPDYASYAGIQ